MRNYPLKKSFLRHAFQTSMAVGLISLLPSQSRGSSIYWHPSSNNNWSTSDQNWSLSMGGGSPIAWGASAANENIAVFGTGSTTATLAESLSAGGLQFDAAGYTVSATGGIKTLTLAGSAPFINVAGGLTATLGANVQVMGGNGFAKTGTGTLNITYSAASAANAYFGSETKLIDIQEGILRVSSTGLNNTRTHASVASGAELQLASDLNIGGVSGSGSITNTTGSLRTLSVRGIGTNFSGVISGSIAISKLNGTGSQTLSGATSNTFSGATSVSVGELILAKTADAVAISGANLTLGANAGTIQAKITYQGNDQVSDSTNLSFIGGYRAQATFNLNGHSDSLGVLSSGVAGVGGSYVIDFGLNDTAQTLSFSSLALSGTIQVINFQDGVDLFRSSENPTEFLPLLTLNGETAYAIFNNMDHHWHITTIPEPRTVVFMVCGLIGGLWLSRRQNARKASSTFE